MNFRTLFIYLYLLGLVFSNVLNNNSGNTGIAYSGANIKKIDSAEINTYHELISLYPQFLNSNYFEDDSYYYYLSVYDNSNKNKSKRSNRNKSKISKSKARLKAVSDLNNSICCGFDTNVFFKSLRNTKFVDTKKNILSHSFQVNSNTSEFTNLETLFYESDRNSIITAIRINKTDITTSTSCECNITIN